MNRFNYLHRSILLSRLNHCWTERGWWSRWCYDDGFVLNIVFCFVNWNILLVNVIRNFWRWLLSIVYFLVRNSLILPYYLFRIFIHKSRHFDHFYKFAIFFVLFDLLFIYKIRIWLLFEDKIDTLSI